MVTLQSRYFLTTQLKYVCMYNHSFWCTGPLAQSIGRPNTARQLSDHQWAKLHSARTVLLLQTAAGTRRLSVGPVRPVSSADAWHRLCLCPLAADWAAPSAGTIACLSLPPPSPGAPPRCFVWRDGFVGTQTHLTPKFSFSSDFGHFISKVVENAKLSYVSRNKRC